MKEIEKILKEIIDTAGIEYLCREPFKVYKALMKEDVDPKLCRCILSTLLAGIPTDIFGGNTEEVSKHIQKECLYKKGAADQLAKMYLSLFKSENISEWKDKTEEGFREFCDMIWAYEYDDSDTWHSSGGYVTCYCTIDIEYQVADSSVLKQFIANDLKKNPFLTSGAICGIVEKKLDDIIRDDIHEYVTSDDYYEPWMEDYDCEDVVKKFFQEKGLELVSIEIDASQSDFEPDSYRW